LTDEVRPGVGVMIRSVLFAIWLYGSLAVVAILWLPTLLAPHRVTETAAHVWIRIVIFGLRWIVGVRIELRGAEHRPKGPAIVAAKHQGMLDIMEPFLALYRPSFVLKRELAKLPVFGWYCAKLGMIPVDRGGGSPAVKALVAKAEDRLAKGHQVLIFPEGTRKRPGAPPEYKSGVAALYRDLGLPVTPMATNSGQCWPARGLAKYPGLVVFEFLPPIPPGLQRAEFMRRLEEAIEARSTALLDLNPRR
jgi:1-acyl-sn-glycerol-3-phosphate acyltransferase